MTLAILSSVLMTGCKSDDYETGDGSLSYLHTEMCDIVAKAGLITSITTDDDVALPFQKGLGLTNCPNDTILRMMLYYTQPAATDEIKIIGNNSVSVLPAADTMKIEGIVTLGSLWVSNNKRYVNVNLQRPAGADSLYSTQEYYSQPFAEGQDKMVVRYQTSKQDTIRKVVNKYSL